MEAEASIERAARHLLDVVEEKTSSSTSTTTEEYNTDEFAKQLRPKFLAAQRELMEGKNGLLTSARLLADIHIKTRNYHFSSLIKGGK